MFSRWILLRQLEQGRSVSEVARIAGVCEMEIQKLLTCGECGRFVNARLEKTLVGSEMAAGSAKA